MRRLLLIALLALVPATAAAQASQFGVRGLGAPGRPLSTRAAGASGAFGMFDSESSLNPAALGGLAAMTATFNGTQSFRTADNPAGSESLRESRFPHVSFGGPVRGSPFAFGISYSTYTNRDFSAATADTVELREVLVPVYDTLSSRGGVSDLRFAGSFKARERTVLGGALHVFTGTNRMESHRSFADSQYLPVQQSAELSYAGVGASLGVVQQVSVPPQAMNQLNVGVGLAPSTQVVVENVTGSTTRSNNWITYQSTVNSFTGDAWSELGVTGSTQ